MRSAAGSEATPVPEQSSRRAPRWWSAGTGPPAIRAENSRTSGHSFQSVTRWPSSSLCLARTRVVSSNRAPVDQAPAAQGQGDLTVPPTAGVSGRKAPKREVVSSARPPGSAWLVDHLHQPRRRQASGARASVVQAAGDGRNTTSRYCRPWRQRRAAGAPRSPTGPGGRSQGSGWLECQRGALGSVCGFSNSTKAMNARSTVLGPAARPPLWSMAVVVRGRHGGCANLSSGPSRTFVGQFF